MAFALEREESSLYLVPEQRREVTLAPVKELNLEQLAAKTKGIYAKNLVVWGPDDGVANGKLKKETRGNHPETVKTTYFLRSETFSDDVTDYMAVIEEDEIALIDATNPLTNVIYGFKIKDGSVQRIMGNQSKFEDENPQYIQARNLAFEKKYSPSQLH